MVDDVLKIQHIDNKEFANFYDPKRKVIILDQNLKDYPEAYNYVLEHEFKHHEIEYDILKNVKHDLKELWFHHSSNSEVAKQMRDYYSEDLELIETKDLKAIIANLIVGFSSFFIWITAFLYRKIKNVEDKPA